MLPMSQHKDVKLGVVLDNPTEAVERIAGDAKRGDDPVAKAERLLDAVERDEALQKGAVDDPVAKANALLDEVLQSDDPNYVTKRAREEALSKWRAEPLPPKTAGPGVPHLPVEKIERMAKINGFGMRESDYFRKL
jgi:hypothetical protein